MGEGTTELRRENLRRYCLKDHYNSMEFVHPQNYFAIWRLYGLALHICDRSLSCAFSIELSYYIC